MYAGEVDGDEEAGNGEILSFSEVIFWAGAFVEGNEESGCDEAEDVVAFEDGFGCEAYVVYDLGDEEHVGEEDEPFVVGAEVVEGEVEEESQIWLWLWYRRRCRRW